MSACCIVFNIGSLHDTKVSFDVQTAEEAMTPIESTFSLDVNSNLDWCVFLWTFFSSSFVFILL